MIEIFKKVIYIYLILVINVYLGAYIKSKITARAGLTRGVASGWGGGIFYPLTKTLKYLSKDSKISFFEVLLFFFAFLMWTVVPFSQTLILLKFDADLIAAVFFYLVLLFLIMLSSSNSSYGFIYKIFKKKMLMVFSTFIPIVFSISGLILISRSLNLKEIVGLQYQLWNIIYQPLGFLVFFASVFMQFKLFGITANNPVLLSENIEKEGQGLGRLIIRLSYYSGIFFLMVLMIELYLAGWQNYLFINGYVLFGLKFYIMFFIILLLDRATPKLNDYNYIVGISWKFLIPVAALNFIMTLVFFILRNIYHLV